MRRQSIVDVHGEEERLRIGFRPCGSALLCALALASCDPYLGIHQHVVLDPSVRASAIQERLAPFEFTWASPYLSGSPECEEVRPAAVRGAGGHIGLRWIARRHVLDIRTGDIAMGPIAEEVAAQVRAHERIFEQLLPLLSAESRAAGVLLRAEGVWDDEELQEHLEGLRAAGTLGLPGARTPAGR
ncbi:MAG: hypothetical protein JNM84_13395 [Planctomycetes bacterium]|nr:hypothetical protein [Planctomycetota bacterium]